MLLAVDVGNTFIKAAVFEGHTHLNGYVFSKNILQKKIETILLQHPLIKDLVIASVGNVEETVFLQWNSRIKIHFINHNTSFPFQNLYTTPSTLGIDRMVLSAGAVFQFPDKNRLVIDAGTCVTYDFIEANNNYLGGAITPGIRLRYQALHQYTAKLPLLSIEEIIEKDNSDFQPHLTGNSTQQSIHSGVINGLVYEINGFIAQYEEQNSNFIIILTGGDADFLAKRLKNTIFANRNFLLESLNSLYLYNFKND